MSHHEIFFIIGSYLLGSIPFGFILNYFNVPGAGGKPAGIVALAFALDMARGILPVLYGWKHFDSPVIIIGGGAAVILGHLFPLYLKFKGGKGVAPLLGVLLVFHFPSAVVFGAAFLATVYFTGYVSAGSIAGTAAAFFVTLFTGVAEVSMIVFGVVILVLIKHRGNIARIIAGTEKRKSIGREKNG